MLNYARSDTHFLLFIYDHLRNALLDRAQSRAQSPSTASEPAPSTSSAVNPSHALVREVLSRSEETALRVLEREVYDAEGGSGPAGWDTLARKWNKGALMAGERETVRRRIYKAVHAWRDRAAREEDESTRYVLPNHYLFVLAEQPPADIAGLLSLFQHVPPVVRRRAKELFEAIRQAAAVSSEESVVPTPTAPQAPQEPIQVDDASSTQTGETLPTDKASMLWSSGTAQRMTVSSSLFGNTIKSVTKATGPAHLTASRSSLFTINGSSSAAELHRKRLQDVVSRIHGSLAIAPSVPKIVAPAAAAVAEQAEEVPGQVEMPFVPASERQETARTVTAETAKDSIVVVGQSQRKKRKRVAAVNVEREGEVEETFDYSTVSNILDEGSDHEPEAVGGGRKRRQKTQGRFDYGGFRAPPKAHSEVKSGNQSRTFK
ncbi:uncharacterized protein PHACADRAFT_214164 [Phanerochaete carnosa HHB-10118-sp]|uniref:HRDC domain-containing protein n=1 Tax=Phanerochaete carnosa (strain HHB-10118-sp) TaxID=650164 RepID=K5VSR9_PHACS|nr:uncharacterized protein PHACADRAFT_214164 [Phanerochaete carnosa HHB-10118-sp]EKM49624.1 hypothetical protein PHACADRAFT_214164 [Phanerochaete carnosa HHB-10118-sp]